MLSEHFTSNFVCRVSSAAHQGSKSKSAISKSSQQPLLSAISSLCECGACVCLWHGKWLSIANARRKPIAERAANPSARRPKCARRHQQRQTRSALCTYACRLPHLHTNGISSAAPVHCLCVCASEWASFEGAMCIVVYVLVCVFACNLSAW